MKPVRKIKNRALCAGWQAWLLIRRSKLKLYAISGPEVLVFSGNPVCITWQVSGCYKVIINNRFTLPGYITAVQLDSRQVPDVLQIQFFGFARQITKRFTIQKMKVSLKESPTVNLPNCKHKVKLEHKWPDFFTTTRLKAVSPQAVPALRQQALHLFPAPFFDVPVLNMQLEPYPLQLTQPDYETTVL